jgi:hypothetical protein
MKTIASALVVLVVAAAVNARAADAKPAPVTYRYSQSAGTLSGGAGATAVNASGYSGRGTGLNQPAAQTVRNNGPIPAGTYNATSVTRSKGPNTIVLTPAPGTNTHGRDNFRIHGDNAAANRTASQGCIIVGPAARATISREVRAGRPVQISVGAR